MQSICNQGRKYWTTQAYSSEIFDVNPHCSPMDATVERNIETRGGKGNSVLRQRVYDYNIPYNNGQKFAVNG